MKIILVELGLIREKSFEERLGSLRLGNFSPAGLTEANSQAVNSLRGPGAASRSQGSQQEARTLSRQLRGNESCKHLACAWQRILLTETSR